jgi:Tfa2 E-tether
MAEMKNTLSQNRQAFERRWEKAGAATGGERELALDRETREQELLRLAQRRSAGGQQQKQQKQQEGSSQQRGGRHAGVLQMVVFNFLDPHRWSSVADILRETEVDLAARPDVAQLLSQNDHVEVSEEDTAGARMYRKRAAFRGIFDKDGLRKLINDPDRVEGLEADQLAECYASAREDLEELVEESAIVAIEHKETGQIICFPLDERFQVTMSEEFRELWKDVKVPDDSDLRIGLAKSGIAVSSKVKKRAPRPKAARRRVTRRPTKFVNTHIDIAAIYEENAE